MINIKFELLFNYLNKYLSYYIIQIKIYQEIRQLDLHYRQLVNRLKQNSYIIILTKPDVKSFC